MPKMVKMTKANRSIGLKMKDFHPAGMAELADSADSKPPGGSEVHSKSIFQGKFDLPVVYCGIGYGGATGNINADL